MTDTPTPQLDLSDEHLEFLADAALSVNASKPTLVAMLRSVRDQARAAGWKAALLWAAEQECVGCRNGDRLTPDFSHHTSIGPLRAMAVCSASWLRRAAAEGGKDACPHDRLNEDGICRSCGADKRGIG